MVLTIFSHMCRIMMIMCVCFVLKGCKTIYFEYPTPETYIADKNITLTLGEFKNELGYSNPNRIHFNVWLDRPVSQAIRNAVSVEIQRAGYTIGESPYEISGRILSIVYAPDHTLIGFKVLDKKTDNVLYDKNVRVDAGTMGLFDEKGHIQEVKACILKFLKDSDFRVRFPAYVKEK